MTANSLTNLEVDCRSASVILKLCAPGSSESALTSRTYELFGVDVGEGGSRGNRAGTGT